MSARRIASRDGMNIGIIEHLVRTKAESALFEYIDKHSGNLRLTPREQAEYYKAGFLE